MEKLIEEQEEKKFGKIRWFFAVIVIPTLFALTVAVLVLTVAGVNVFEKADELRDKIPFLPTKQEISKKESLKQMQSNIDSIRAELKDKKSVIAQLETDAEDKDKEIEKLKVEKRQLEMQMDDLLKTNNNNKGTQSYQDIINTYETMSPKKSAPIITAMNEDEAVQILSNLKPENLALILENMDQTNAAKYTALLTKKANSNNSQ